MSRLDRLTIRGFRSIESLENFEPGPLTVLIGPNGAGKSNFVEFFRMLRKMTDEAFQAYAEEIGPETLFFMGPRQTPQISARLEFGQNVYEFDLRARAGGGVFIGAERVRYTGGQGLGPLRTIGSATQESCLKRLKDEPAAWAKGPGVPGHVYDAVSSWTVYHVHDTRLHSPMRGWGSTSHKLRLEHDASNLAAVLLHLRESHPTTYDTIRTIVRTAAPFFDDFHLEPAQRGREEQVRLDWLQKGSQEPFQPTVLSDGTLRLIALATALHQPNPPSTIVIDEPELGLHPLAINLLGASIRSAATRGWRRVIVSTQSPLLVDEVEPTDIVVVERENGRSIFRRLDVAALQEWLAEYSLGELWQKNLLGGRPSRD